MESVYAENGRSAFETCGVVFLQAVFTPNGQGRVQGILREPDGRLKVIVSHTPGSIPADMIPEGSHWKLIYYDPDEVFQTEKERDKYVRLCETNKSAIEG